jgi:hypothetical protein
MEAKEIHEKIDKIDPNVAQISMALKRIIAVLHDLTDEINILQSGFASTETIKKDGSCKPPYMMGKVDE